MCAGKHQRRWQGDLIPSISTNSTSASFFDHHPTSNGRTEVGIDHAYALTSYAVQGSTHHLSTSRIDATTTRAETYVNITRGRNANHLYLTPTTDPLNGETLPKLPSLPADRTVTERLQRSTNEITAWELAHPTNQTNGQAAKMVIGL